MENRYIDNPAIELYCSQIEPGYREKEIQVLWENLLWTVYPAQDHWSIQTKQQQNTGEPDNQVLKLLQFTGRRASVDVLVVELKRPRENISQGAFEEVAQNQLDDYMLESSNPDGSALFSAVGIGKSVQFYSKELPYGKQKVLHDQPYHIYHDAGHVQDMVDYFKINIPVASNTPAPVLEDS